MTLFKEVAKICTVVGCPSRVLAKNLCSKHYDRYRKTGSTELVMKAGRGCGVDDCDRPHYGHGLCALHYQRESRIGSTSLTESVPQKDLPCAEDGCGRLVHAKGLCQAHYRRMQREARGLRRPGRKAAPTPSLDAMPPACPKGHRWSAESAYVEGNRLRCKFCIREQVVRRLYGLTAEQFLQLLVSQEGLCAICEEPLDTDEYKGIHVDHDHATGEVRGLLCRSCNTGLGLLKDSGVALQRALAYVQGESRVRS